MKKSKDFIKKHEYPGGKEAFQKFIKENLTYPKKALENKIQGKVLLSYTIDFDGSISEAKVLKGIGFGCDEEAVRLVKLLKFAPQNNHGLRLSSTHKIKIEFKFEERPQPQPATKITYTYTTSKPKPQTAENQQPATPKNYSYKIIVK
jgi:protein TonB